VEVFGLLLEGQNQLTLEQVELFLGQAQSSALWLGDRGRL